jgi:hypothetical protein
MNPATQPIKTRGINISNRLKSLYIFSISASECQLNNMSGFRKWTFSKKNSGTRLHMTRPKKTIH